MDFYLSLKHLGRMESALSHPNSIGTLFENILLCTKGLPRLDSLCLKNVKQLLQSSLLSYLLCLCQGPDEEDPLQLQHFLDVEEESEGNGFLSVR